MSTQSVRVRSCLCARLCTCAWQQMLVQWRHPTSPGRNRREMLLKGERGEEKEGGGGWCQEKERESKRELCAECQAAWY